MGEDVYFWGRLDVLDHAAAVMLHLGSLLLIDSDTDKKITFTIERNPETGEFTITREVGT